MPTQRPHQPTFSFRIEGDPIPLALLAQGSDAVRRLLSHVAGDLQHGLGDRLGWVVTHVAKGSVELGIDPGEDGSTTRELAGRVTFRSWKG